MLQKLQFPEKDYPELLDFCNNIDIEFLSTPYNEEDVDFLFSLGVKRLKLASISIAEPHFVKYAASTGLPLILSTGMATMAEIELALDAAYSVNNRNLTVLQCTTNYPSMIEDTNLLAMLSIRKASKFLLVILIIRRLIQRALQQLHLVQRLLKSTLHLTNLLQVLIIHVLANLKNSVFVSKVRDVELCLGSGIKSPTQAELLNMPDAKELSGPI